MHASVLSWYDYEFYQQGYSDVFLKVVQLRQEIGNMYVIDKDVEMSEKDVLCVLPTPASIFEYNCSNSSFSQLCQEV